MNDLAGKAQLSSPGILTSMNIFELSQVDPMMVREFNVSVVTGKPYYFRDKVVFTDEDQFECREIGLADKRLSFDRDVLDQSNGVFEFTNMIIFGELGDKPHRYAIFTSSRWRTHRSEETNEFDWPLPVFQFIGNPIIIDAVENDENFSISGRKALSPIVYREPSYLIKSGAQLIHEKEFTA